MKISRDQFLSEMRDSLPLLEFWARESASIISKMVEAEIGFERFKGFFKIEPTIRIKTENSALKKFECWDHLNSAQEMHDLAGIRFVVLLRTDLQVIEDVIKGFPSWSTLGVRHFENDANDDPEVFDYQSIHLLIKGSKGFLFGGRILEDDVTCEVQIRTLLQHAYAELCHDKLYKNFRKIPASAKRLVARSMALMETTDSIFCETAKQLEDVAANRNKWFEYLAEIYGNAVKIDPPCNDLVCPVVFDRFYHLLENVRLSEVGSVVDFDLIKSRMIIRLSDSLFSSPACVLTYWLVQNHFVETRRLWPDESLLPGLKLICADLGISCD